MSVLVDTFGIVNFKDTEIAPNVVVSKCAPYCLTLVHTTEIDDIMYGNEREIKEAIKRILVKLSDLKKERKYPDFYYNAVAKYIMNLISDRDHIETLLANEFNANALLSKDGSRIIRELMEQSGIYLMFAKLRAVYIRKKIAKIV